MLLPFREPPAEESYPMKQLPDTQPEGPASNSDPTVGAQYQWSARFASRYPEFWGFMKGWVTVFSWIVDVGVGLAVLFNMISSLIIFNDESYEPTGWNTTLYMLAFVAGPLMYDLFTRKTLNILGNISGVCHWL
ncbi:hypothetical protein QBC37DRAFT_377270 [Rhypophila decipiens]|uniref:Uncharacterized protein n=1 Tax=Rhypophila decipiens TaxID=261697 RepID=A0AAN6Y0X5_9PEZI|nr:hypothetical protein QBC37DRAFT_377270 [Rhypophila decipiens]